MSEPIFRLPPYSVNEVMAALAQTADWSHAFMGVPDAWKRSRGKGALVAVLDTGIQENHPDLAGQIVAAKDFTGSRSSYNDVNGHGTHCAGIIAGIDNQIGVVGVAPESKLLVGKVLGDDGSGGSQGIANGIDWAIENNAHVISMSLGSSSPSSVIHAACKRAHKAGVILICAAGNEGPGPNTSGYPASHPECISVAALDKDGKAANFSSRGKVDIAAPGVNIRSTYPGSKYASLSGTSMATPGAAGNASLVVSVCLQAVLPLPDTEQFRGMLRGCSIDQGALGKDGTFGFGFIDPAFLIENTGPKPPAMG